MKSLQRAAMLTLVLASTIAICVAYVHKGNGCHLWDNRMWPPPSRASFTDLPRIPDDIVVSVGSVSDYVFDFSHILAKHTNPAVFGTERATGRKVVVKLRLHRSYERAFHVDRNFTAGGAKDSASSNTLFSDQWAVCTGATCPDAALRNNRSRQVPAKGIEFAKLQAALGQGSLNDELFIGAVLAPDLCNVPDGITPLLDV